MSKKQLGTIILIKSIFRNWNKSKYNFKNKYL